MKGRKPTAKRLKIARGTDRKDRAKKPPKPDADIVLAEWKRVAPELVRLGVLTVLDRSTFSVYCCLWKDYVEIRKELEKEGRTFTAENLMKKRHPLVAQLANTSQQLRLYGEMFGLDPIGRGRLDVGAPNQEPDPFEELMKRGGKRQA